MDQELPRSCRGGNITGGYISQCLAQWNLYTNSDRNKEVVAQYILGASGCMVNLAV